MDSKGPAFGGVQGQSPWRVRGSALVFLASPRYSPRGEGFGDELG